VTHARPRPVPEEQSAPYWDFAARGVLALARCGRCGRFAHPPDVVCPWCHHTDPGFVFEPVPGRGTVRSWTVVRQSFLPGFDVPFVLVDVALALGADDDVRLIGRLVDGPDAPLRIGVEVTATFERLDGAVAVPAFALVGPA
jgi:uncharacterized OB-fold protein